MRQKNRFINAGGARGTFNLRPDLPGDLRVGVFALKNFPARVRFSSDTKPSKPDLKTTPGIAGNGLRERIKVAVKFDGNLYLPCDL